MRLVDGEIMNCKSCARELTIGVAEYSEKYFGMPLCIDCQEVFKEKVEYNDSLEETLQKIKDSRVK